MFKVKPYAAMAATHGSIDCIRKLQEEDPEDMKRCGDIERIVLQMGEVAFHHGGFEVKRPLTSVGAQMGISYVAITQLVDREVTPQCFHRDKLDRDEIWNLVDKTKCVQNDAWKWEESTEVTFMDGKVLKVEVKSPRGVDPDLTNEEIVEKWRLLTKGVVDDERRDQIEKLCLGLEEVGDVLELSKLLAGVTQNPIA